MVMDTVSETGMWCDLHCHVLPGIDDGCKSVQESVLLMKASWKQGIYGIVATPHYYPKESIAAFLKRREDAAQRLQARLRRETQVPKLCCGAEVAYHSGLAFDEDLGAVCMGHSRYLLLELPFAPWPPKLLRDIAEITGRGFTPVIAHVERYLKYQTRETIQALFELDVLIQMNAEAMMGRWKGHNARRMIYRGQIDVLGSDAHNLKDRAPDLGNAAARYANSRLSNELEMIRQRNQMIFEAAMR